MRKKLHHPDGLAGMEDPQTEFRLALSQLDEPELLAIRNKMLPEDRSERDVLAEHLVLHSLPVVSEICRREGASVGMGGEDVGTAYIARLNWLQTRSCASRRRRTPRR